MSQFQKTADAKTPAAVLDYDWDLSLWLAGDTVVGFTTAVTPSGLTLVSQAHTLTVCKQWASGGVAGIDYRLTFTVTTALGRVEAFDMYIPVRE